MLLMATRYYAVLVFVTLTYATYGTNVTLNGSCKYGKLYFPSLDTMRVLATLTSGNNLSFLHCIIWYEFSEGILQLWLQKTTFSERGFLITTVLDSSGSLVLPGYVIDARESVSYPSHICPPSGDQARNYSIFLSGPPNTGINLTVQVDESVLHQEQTKTLVFSNMVSSRLLVFDVQQIQNIQDHFQVTVRSDDTEHECLLVVSDECSAISDIHPQSINFKDRGRLLRLTFTTFGRIHLTHASKPELKTGRWFVGVFLKNPKGVKIDKIVHLSVGFAGGVQRMSTGLPVLYVVLLAIFVGLAIAVFAEFFLNPHVENKLVINLHRYLDTYVFAEKEKKKPDDINEETGMTSCGTSCTQSPSPTIEVGPSICNDAPQCDDGNVSAPSYNIVNVTQPKRWPGFKAWGNVFLNWVFGEGKKFAYITAIVAFSLLTGAAQFIISNWKDMIDSGDRDICYYNDGCYRTTHHLDVPNNLIISNVPFLINGFILAISLSLREAMCNVNQWPVNTKHLSVHYALAWAFVAQGIFSSFYHLCPSRLTFQFDSAIMFVISGLVIAALFNSNTWTNTDNETCSKQPLQDTKLFLFFVIPIFLLNYLGSISDTEGLMTFPVAAFYCLTITWLLWMFAWAFYRLLIPFEPKEHGANFWCKVTWLCVLFPIFLIIVGFMTVGIKQNWSMFFLYACLLAVLCAVCGCCFSQCRKNLHSRRMKQYLPESTVERVRWVQFFRWPLYNIHVLLFTICVMACWTLAIYNYQVNPVSDKAKKPSQSRMMNKECVLWNFFDYHDLWHILSSFALLSSAYLTLWCVG